MFLLKLVSVILIAQNVFAGPLKADIRKHPDAGLDIYQLVDKYGYISETHYAITEDDFILGVQRIPGRKDEAPTTGKPVVLLMHGLASSASDWCNMGVSSLSYILSDLGYDVWLGNARGTTWSRNHTTLNPDSTDPEERAKFWTFSWNEIGNHDLPAMIDMILAKTGQEQLNYVGHSQGTTSFFVMASDRPEYNDKIRLMTALAPVAFMSHLYSPMIRFIAQYEENLTNLSQIIGLDEFLPHTDFVEGIAGELCDEENPLHDVCSFFLFLLCGFDEEQMDPAMLPVITTNAPAGTAVNQWIHYAQGINSGLFRKFNYGKEKNLELYGQEEPPKYNLENISAKVALFYSANDWLAAEVDVEELHSKLPNVVKFHRNPFEKFNHLDFIWATDVVTLLYNEVIAVFQQH